MEREGGEEGKERMGTRGYSYLSHLQDGNDT